MKPGKTIRMRKEDWEKWDAALRSGKYAQGHGRLQDGDKFCCLGVLEHCLTGQVEIYGDRPAGLPSFKWLREHHIECIVNNELVQDPWIPVLSGGIGCSASRANDNLRKDFVQIADAITECVEFIE